MSSTKPGRPDDADAAKAVDGDSHYEGSDMDRAVTEAEGGQASESRETPPAQPKTP